MSIIPVICHNYLRNCSERNSSNNSLSNVTKENNSFINTDKVIPLEDFIKGYYKSKNSNNTRGGVRL